MCCGVQQQRIYRKAVGTIVYNNRNDKVKTPATCIYHCRENTETGIAHTLKETEHTHTNIHIIYTSLSLHVTENRKRDQSK